MFDNITCKYPLSVEGANELEYQTKDTPRQFLDDYEIKEDGTLHYLNYDTVDNSNIAKWRKENPNATEEPLWDVSDYAGCMERVDEEWLQELFTGVVQFYSFWDDNKQKGWIEWAATFANGEIQHLKLIKNKKS